MIACADNNDWFIVWTEWRTDKTTNCFWFWNKTYENPLDAVPMERRRSSRRRPKQPFAQRAKEHCRQFTAFMFSNVGIIILVVIYMIGGEWFIRPLTPVFVYVVWFTNCRQSVCVSFYIFVVSRMEHFFY